MAKAQINFGELGGEDITTLEVVNGRVSVSTSALSPFSKDYKYVICETYGGGTNPNSYRINGTIEPFYTASGAGSQYSQSYPTDLALFKDVKSSDTLSITTGTLLTTIIGLN